MTVKQQIIAEIEDSDNPITLVQIFEIMQLVKQNLDTPQHNTVISQYAGCLDDNDAQEMQNIIAREFSHIEGEW